MTPKQEKVVNGIVENLGSGGTKSKGEILREAGYSESVADNPEQIFSSPTIKEETKSIVKQLEKERQRAISALAGKIDEAKYRDLNDGIDKLTKNIQLLTGGDTERNNQPVLVKFIDGTEQNN